MSGSVLTYDPSSVTITVAGYIIPGIVSLNLQWNSEAYTVKRGIRGQHTRVYNQDRHATLVVELLPTSVANDVFSSIVLQDTTSHSALLTVSLKDISGTTRFTTENAYLRSWPDVSFNALGVTTRRWDIEILSFSAAWGNVGGNASNGIDITDILNSASEKASAILDDGLSAVSGYFS